MLKIIWILLATMLLAACDGKFIKRSVTNRCDTTGWTLTAVHYGDSRIVVIPISEIVKDAEFRFELLPASKTTDSKDYKDVEVKIRGKRSPDDDWFEEISAKATDGVGALWTCIDGASLNTGDDAYYEVEVVGVGTLDPRAKIIIRP